MPDKVSETKLERDTLAEWDAMPVSHEQAREAILALVDEHFRNLTYRRSQFSIPVRPDDTDILLCRYVKQQAARSHSQLDVSSSSHCSSCGSLLECVDVVTNGESKRLHNCCPTCDGRGDAAEQGDAKLPPFICKCGHTHGEHRFDLVADPFCEECECEAYAGPMPPTQKEMLENAQLAARKLAEALRDAYKLLNYMGDYLNEVACPTPEEVKFATPIFEKIRAALAPYSSSVEGKDK